MLDFEGLEGAFARVPSDRILALVILLGAC
jgi:hypothetical protein